VTSTSAPHRIKAFDGLRGLAVLMVVASHVSSYHGIWVVALVWHVVAIVLPVVTATSDTVPIPLSQRPGLPNRGRHSF
jgi:surface polysaccharide O-acyltransferase-like enzyme